MGRFSVVNHAFWIKKRTTNLPTNYQYGFQGISWCVHEVVFG
jgi:hypothetical protein